MKKCWPCRRRRLKCDGTLPRCQKCHANGVECTYTKPLKWVGGVASRGHLTNSTFGEVDALRGATPSPASNPPRTTRGFESGPSSRQGDQRLSTDVVENVADLPIMPTVSRSLTEPIFQDLGHNARYLMDYFEQRVCSAVFPSNSATNPYRRAIPMLGSSPALASAILAVAACHCAHSVTGKPLFSFLASHTSRLAPTTRAVLPVSPNYTFNISESDLTSQYLVLKHNSLSQLSLALADPDTGHQSATLAAVLCLVLLEVLETGAGVWSVHVEGAVNLLQAGLNSRNTTHASLLKAMIAELRLVDTFGSTISRPGTLPMSFSSRIASDVEDESFGMLGIGCPAEFLPVIESLSSQRQAIAAAGTGQSHMHIQSLYATLRQIKDFDAHNWAAGVVSASLEAPQFTTTSDLSHIGTMWKLATEIYASRLLFNLTKDPALSHSLVDTLRDEYAIVGADHQLVAGLVWPTFISGAASTRPEQRTWALEVLETIWNRSLCANSKNATYVLSRLWEKQDLARRQAGAEESFDWDWIGELSSLEERWLFA